MSLLKILRIKLVSRQDLLPLLVRLPPDRETEHSHTHTRPRYFSVQFVHVYFIETLQCVPRWNMAKRLFHHECDRTILLLFQEITKVETRWILFCVIRFSMIAVVWYRKVILNHLVLHKAFLWRMDVRTIDKSVIQELLVITIKHNDSVTPYTSIFILTATYFGGPGVA